MHDSAKIERWDEGEKGKDGEFGSLSKWWSFYKTRMKSKLKNAVLVLADSLVCL